jgi:hypothetical protein
LGDLHHGLTELKAQGKLSKTQITDADEILSKLAAIEHLESKFMPFYHEIELQKSFSV